MNPSVPEYRTFQGCHDSAILQLSFHILKFLLKRLDFIFMALCRLWLGFQSSIKIPPFRDSTINKFSLLQSLVTQNYFAHFERLQDRKHDMYIQQAVDSSCLTLF